MRALALIPLLFLPLAISPTFAAKKPPPPPEPAIDVQCDGCVDTTDIADGSVTPEKLDQYVGAFPPLVWVDANGEVIGKDIETFGTLDQRVVESSHGYRFVFNPTNGFVGIGHLIYYRNSDCTGRTYIYYRDGGPGYVFRQDQTGNIFYTNFIYAPAKPYTNSHGTPTNCQYGGLPYEGLEVFPNNPDVTGVSGGPYSLPLSREPLF